MNNKHIPERRCTALKRIAVILAVLSMVLCVFPQTAVKTSAVDVYQFSQDGFYYTISAVSGTIEASIVGYNFEESGKAAIVIPAILGSYPVTSISSDAFAGQTGITSVSIPQNIRSIGTGAFQNCTGLKSVTMAAGITEISESTFKGCSALASVSVPNTVTRIGASAFEDCVLLKTATLAEGLLSLGNYAFRRCYSLQAMNMPNSLETLGEGAFEECTALVNVKFSTSLSAINDFTFYKCTLLSPVSLTENISYIGRYAFSECSAITSVAFPKSVLTISSNAFANDRSLAVAIIPNTTSNISDTAFDNDPVAIYGYTGTYAESYARRNFIPFTSYGSVYNITFSADIYYATVDNISIKSTGGTIVPPSTVLNDEELTITVTAPAGFVIDSITINGESFANGSTYRVHNSDVNIFVSYRTKDAPEVTTPTTAPRVDPVSVSTTTTTTPPVTTTTSRTTTTTEELIPVPQEDNTVDDPVPENDSDTNSYVKVNSDLKDINGVNVRISTKKEYFIGPATVRLTNTSEADAACAEAFNAIINDNSIYYAFDISLQDANGNENNGILANGTIMFMIPVPNSMLPYIDDIRVYHITDGEAVMLKSSIIEDINEVKRVQFESDSFSPYMFVAGTDETVPIIEEGEDTTAENPPQDNQGSSGGNTGNNDNNNSSGGGNDAKIIDDKNTTPANNGNRNPYTGQIIAIGIPTAALVSALLVRSHRKRKRAKTEVH